MTGALKLRVRFGLLPLYNEDEMHISGYRQYMWYLQCSFFDSIMPKIYYKYHNTFKNNTLQLNLRSNWIDNNYFIFSEGLWNFLAI